MTNSASSNHSTTTVTKSAGSRKRRALAAVITTASRSGKDFGDPAVHDTLAVGACVRVVDREDLRVLEDRSKRGFGLHFGMRRHEIDLVLGVQRLHRRAGRPVNQFLARCRVLRASEKRDALCRCADALLREADHNAVTLGLGVERIDDEKDAAGRLPESDRQRAAAAALRVELHTLAQLLQKRERLLLVATVDLLYGENTRNRSARGARIGHLQ